jgi:hypothetical protein
MGNMYTDWKETDTEGYHILGVSNVNVKVPASQLVSFISSHEISGVSATAPTQYKTLNADGTVGSTNYSVADTVKNATAVLVTGSNWGDYQINVTDPDGVKYLRNGRTDDGFAINSNIQGIILTATTADGKELKVGMEYLQSIWVQPWEVSFNVPADNTHNTHIASWDNLSELSKLVDSTVTSITYIMPDCIYVYEFDGIYIKPIYSGAVTGSFGDGMTSFSLDAVPEGLTNGTLTITYTVGAGRNSKSTTIYSGDIAATVSLDSAVIEGLEEGGTYSVKITCDNYADFSVKIPVTEEQIASLKALIDEANAILAVKDDNVLKAHRNEATELLEDTTATSADAASLISELKELIASAKA